jgi:hypothetical protein
MTATCETPLQEIHYEPDCSPDELRQVIGVLERWSRRTRKHVTHVRASHRHEYRTTVLVETSEITADGPARRLFHVPARNVSKTGLGIIAPPVFVPKLLSDTTPLLRADTVFRLGAKVKLVLGSQLPNAPVVIAEVIRVRLIHHGFFDIGVRFLAREA